MLFRRSTNWIPTHTTPLCLLAVLAALLLLSSTQSAHAQQPKSTAATPNSHPTQNNKNPPQNTLKLKEQVNLVLVPVIVRNQQGKAVGSLKRKDFRILDDGKPQTITTFSMETNRVGKPVPPNAPLLSKASINSITSPLHFFGYLFDDTHLDAGNLIQARQAAEKHMNSDMGPQDRAAIFTTSGDVETQFTGDKAELIQAMNKIKPGIIPSGAQCPYMNAFLARRIVEESGSGASFGTGQTPLWDAATLDAWNCMFGNSQHLRPEARQEALTAARREEESADAGTQRSLRAVRLAVRRLAAAPGTRNLILVSQGFQIGTDHSSQETIINLATNLKVVVNALDARGLYTGIRGADTHQGPSSADVANIEDPYIREANVMLQAVMSELAYGTGGRFFHDNNNLADGFDELSALPHYVYELGFRPKDLKHPGRYHRLKVKLVDIHGWTIQARRGYSESLGPKAHGMQLTEELEQALFSRNQVKNDPISLQIGYSPQPGAHRKLRVTTHIDVSGIHFHKVNSTNVDNLTLVCGLFDINGNYLQGKKMKIALHLPDKVLKQITKGADIKTTFNVPPGMYQIRVVVRDAGTGLLSTANGSGLIP